jgi:hypothetical protein
VTTWIATRRERVEIVLASGRHLTGDVHLRLAAETHAGPESPVDLLNRSERFFAVTLADDDLLLLAKSHVLFVRLPPHPAFVDPERESAARRLGLEVELADGSRLEGVVIFEMPPDRPRVLDYLNAAPRFFALWTPDAVHLLNRGHVRAVTPLDQVIGGSA